MNRYPGTTTLAEIANAEDSLLSASEYVSGEKRLQMAYNSVLLSEKPYQGDELGLPQAEVP